MNLYRLVHNKGPLVAGISLLLLVAAGTFAPLIAPYGYDDQELRDRLKPPFWVSTQQQVHALGTDELGRDVLTRILYGARASMEVGFSGVILGTLIGSFLGLCAGFFRGWFDLLVMRIGDIQLAFPYLLLAIAMLAVVGPSMIALITVLGIRTWVVYARTIRGVVVSLMARDFTQAARALGASPGRIMFGHLLRNIVAPVTVLASAELGNLILLEATLSFLGLGVQPPMPSWGGMLSTGRVYMTTAWWIATFPGIAMLVAVLAVNRLGDWLRDTLDPRTHSRLVA